MNPSYPKRLIEVDLPIKRISAHARREKSIRHGHISTLHIWWARRPLAACRAVILAALWPDPAGEDCPEGFRQAARERMLRWARECAGKASNESFQRLVRVQKDEHVLDDALELRRCLLDFIADFANWDNSTDPAYLETSRALVQAAHESLGGAPGTRPLVVDPFAGGGAIPLEALRVGADAFASDLNPVAVLLNKVVLEYIPKYGQRLADEVRKWGRWVKDEAEKDLAQFYPKDPDGATPIAYLWARTIKCEGPRCGVSVPMMRSQELARRVDASVALKLGPEADGSQVRIRIPPHVRARSSKLGTARRGSVTCPVCGYTTTVERVRAQLQQRVGGTLDARLMCVVTLGGQGQVGRLYRLPTAGDFQAHASAAAELARYKDLRDGGAVAVIPDERFTGMEPRRIPLPLYGMTGFGDIFGARQMLSLTTLARLVASIDERSASDSPELARVVAACLALAVDRQADALSSLVTWVPAGEFQRNTFARQALAMVWDFAEVNPWADSSGNWLGAIEWIARVCESGPSMISTGEVGHFSATAHRLPDDSADAVITDPPYYHSVPYADLSDYFYVWLRRALPTWRHSLLHGELTPKGDECVQNLAHSGVAHLQKGRSHYERSMSRALEEARRVARPDAIGVVVFAHTDTEAWESLLEALIGAGWCVTGSWPIDTERAGRMLAQRQATLTSSIHLACRPRENQDGSLRADAVGDWREVLSELPERIRAWMPRLAQEGIVGADAIFACLGPALEIFSRHSKVEKASGEEVTLKEYLEHVWAAVAREALSMIFAGAETSGFEEDARLTAMWLWTLSTTANGKADAAADDVAADDDDEAPGSATDGDGKTAKVGGYTLEYDAARKIAQGLGAHLEDLTTIIEVKGETARLLPVAERTRHLFGRTEEQAPTAKRKKRDRQMTLGFAAELDEAEETGGWGDKGVPPRGETVLDRAHQAMILFAAGRGEALRRFLVDEGAGRDQRFWRLAQALAALYPAGSDERRWVEGVQARKKGLGL